jgi:hypothetical protein
MFSLAARRLPLRSLSALRNLKPCTIQTPAVRAITLQRPTAQVFYRSFASQAAEARMYLAKTLPPFIFIPC